MPVAPYYTQPYDPSYGTERMSALVRRRGDIAAQSALMQGAAKAQMGNAIGQGISGAMSDLVRYSQVQQEQQRRDEEMALRKQAAADTHQARQLALNKVEQRDNDLQIMQATEAQFTSTDPKTGKLVVERDKIRSALTAAGKADLVRELDDDWRGADKAALESKTLKQQWETVRAEGLARLARGALRAGGDTGSFLLAIREAEASELVTPEEARQFEEQATKDVLSLPPQLRLGRVRQLLEEFIVEAPSFQKGEQRAPVRVGNNLVSPTGELLYEGPTPTPNRTDFGDYLATRERELGRPLTSRELETARGRWADEARAPRTGGEGGSTDIKPKDYREAAAKKDRAIQANHDKATLQILQERNRRLKGGATDATLADDKDFIAFKTETWNNKAQQDQAAIEAYRSETGWTPDWRERQGGGPPAATPPPPAAPPRSAISAAPSPPGSEIAQVEQRMAEIRAKIDAKQPLTPAEQAEAYQLATRWEQLRSGMGR